MQKKAVIAANGDYLGYADPLVSPKNDVYLWRDRLKTYGFTDIKMLVDADRTSVLAAFKSLVSGSEPGDILIFICECHGRLVAAHENAGEYTLEEALMVRPLPGDTSLKSSEITDSDITTIIKKYGPVAGTHFVIIPDTCYAGNLNIAIPPGATPIAIPAAVELKGDLGPVREFGSLGGGELLLDVERPLIVASCGRSETAFELTVDGVKRMLFTSRATSYLTSHPDATFVSLVHDIQPLKGGIKQTPENRGNTARAGERFPGRPIIQAPAPHLSLTVKSLVVGTAPERAFTTTTTGEGSMNSINIRFQGIICFADSRSTRDPYQMRALFPYDPTRDPDKRHIPYIEIAAEDDDGSAGGNPITGPHVGGGVDFTRWELDGYQIVFTNEQPSATLTTTPLYDKHVPLMKKNVCTDISYSPKDKCFDNPPPLDLIAAYIDLNYGVLDAGTLDNHHTIFTTSTGDPSPYDARPPHFVVLQLPLADPGATIDLVPYNGSAPATIKVKAGSTVMIGNVRRTDMIESYIPVENPSEHFSLFYAIGDGVPTDPPLPAVVGVPVNFCTPVGWP